MREIHSLDAGNIRDYAMYIAYKNGLDFKNTHSKVAEGMESGRYHKAFPRLQRYNKTMQRLKAYTVCRTKPEIKIAE